MFPIFGSITLFGLYLVFRFVDKTYVNYLLTAYFGLLGVMATTQVGVNCVAPIVKLAGINVDKWNLTLTKNKKGKLKVNRKWKPHIPVDGPTSSPGSADQALSFPPTRTLSLHVVWPVHKSN